MKQAPFTIGNPVLYFIMRLHYVFSTVYSVSTQVYDSDLVSHIYSPKNMSIQLVQLTDL